MTDPAHINPRSRIGQEGGIGPRPPASALERRAMIRAFMLDAVIDEMKGGHPRRTGQQAIDECKETWGASMDNSSFYALRRQVWREIRGQRAPGSRHALMSEQPNSLVQVPTPAELWLIRHALDQDLGSGGPYVKSPKVLRALPFTMEDIIRSRNVVIDMSGRVMGSASNRPSGRPRVRLMARGPQKNGEPSSWSIQVSRGPNGPVWVTRADGARKTWASRESVDSQLARMTEAFVDSFSRKKPEWADRQIETIALFPDPPQIDPEREAAERPDTFVVRSPDLKTEEWWADKVAANRLSGAIEIRVSKEASDSLVAEVLPRLLRPLMDAIAIAGVSLSTQKTDADGNTVFVLTEE